MACCELVKENLTIIIIQRITHAFERAFDCAFDICLGRIQMQMFKVHIQMQMHLQFHGGI